MFSKTPPSVPRKRPNEEASAERPKKSPFGTVKADGDALLSEKIFEFRILLPNETTLELQMTERRSEMPIEEFIDAVKREYFNEVKRTGPPRPRRDINWTYPDLHFTDAQGKKIRTEVRFRDFVPNTSQFLTLYDGSPEPNEYEDMWDLTPDTDLLKELPDEYTFETALADLIDNSLQALWSNGRDERRLISVEVKKNRISIFDTGPGMDGVNGKIVKWGKMGASMHRSSREQAIGGKPPYLMPFFGMYGYGGPVATMHLGRRAVISSKTKTCSKVFTLHLERELLINSSRPGKQWKTKGGMRDPLKDEKVQSRHGSFTKVEIMEPKTSALDVKKLQCKLKDIYFPYIQCDEISGKTSTPIEFQVNGVNLTEIQGGEVAITNMHSCNGAEFSLQLHFSCSEETSTSGQIQSSGKKALPEANARVRCVYFPIIKGEESISKIINKLQAIGFEARESFEGFRRVSVRRLGRLLPDARWTWLPFMEPKPKKGEKGQNLKRCCYRVKCYIETDSGFSPTPAKTDLAHQHPYSNALKNFGNRTPGNDKEVKIEIYRDGKKLSLCHLEKEYSDWISAMHDLYDDEIESGLDQPTIITTVNEKLGMSSDVLRVHKEIKRKGTCWKAGQKMKILKGACAGCHKNNVFASLEYVVLGGLAGDACGEARLICRPLGLPQNKGCQLRNDRGNMILDMRDSLSLPISVIDSKKCLAIDDVEWKRQLEKHKQKEPSRIDLLSPDECQELEIEGGLPADTMEAGERLPENLVAVIRPKAFDSASSPKRLDQKFIVRENFEMILEVNFRVTERTNSCDHYSVRMRPSSQKNLHGLYVFHLGSKIDKFRNAGFYSFVFTLAGLKDIRFQQLVRVQAASKIGRSRLVNTPNPKHTVSSENGSSDSRTPPILDLAPPDGSNFSGSSLIRLKELEDDLANCGLTVGKRERGLEKLKRRQSTLQQHISDFQARIIHDSCDVPSKFLKECIERKIESRSNTASAFVCKLKRLALEERPKGMLGVVALLGSVETIELSRMLAIYLGEDQMLAIVCENYAAAESFDTLFSNNFGTKSGQSSTGRYHALCLEDTRPSCSDERKSYFKNLDPLQTPTLPDGGTRHGFLGYAVNMVEMEPKIHLSIRETLFYSLFGGLQVYADKQSMKIARYCIRDGAISLDGAIMRGNGLVSFGHCEPDMPEIVFPVSNKKPVSRRSSQDLERIEAGKLELEAVNRDIEKTTALCDMDRKIFHRSRDRYNNYVSQLSTSGNFRMKGDLPRID